jgi:hypothetical protein
MSEPSEKITTITVNVDIPSQMWKYLPEDINQILEKVVYKRVSELITRATTEFIS